MTSNVGMAWISNRRDNPGEVSTSTFTSLTLPARSTRQLVQHRADHPARPAPGRPEIDENRTEDCSATTGNRSPAATIQGKPGRNCRSAGVRQRAAESGGSSRGAGTRQAGFHTATGARHEKRSVIVGRRLATVAAFLSAGPRRSPPLTEAAGNPCERTGGPLHLSAGHAWIRDGQRRVRGPADPDRRSRHQESPVLRIADWDVAGNAQRDRPRTSLRARAPGPWIRVRSRGMSAASTRTATQRTFGDFAALETEHNADGEAHYGFHNLPTAAQPSCLPEMPAAYKGDVDSHPYGITVSGRTIYVADAGANSVVSVDIETGKTETVAVLPPGRSRLRPKPRPPTTCRPAWWAGPTTSSRYPPMLPWGRTAGSTSSSLPGGPEDPSLGARGAVFKVDPDNGHVKLFADEIMSPTGLAVDDDGDVYVASLFGEGVLKIDRDSGKQSVVLSAGLTADVDLRGSTLYATVNALPRGPRDRHRPTARSCPSSLGHGIAQTTDSAPRQHKWPGPVPGPAIPLPVAVPRAVARHPTCCGPRRSRRRR